MTAVFRNIGRFYLILVMLFAVSPAVIVLVDSVNSATSFPSPFEHATLHWYAALLDHSEFLDAMIVSAEVAVVAACAATLAAFLAGYTLVRYPLRGRHVIATALAGPLFVPEIVMGLAILQLTGVLDIPLTLAWLAAIHTVFVMPFVLRLVLAGFSRFDFNLEDAARSLGAGQSRALWQITLPLIRPSLIAGFTLAAILSFVNLPLSMFLTTPRTATLPVVVFAYMESRIDPLVAAVATLVVVVAAVATICLDRVLKIRLLG